MQTTDVPAARDGDEKPGNAQQGGLGPRQSHKLPKAGSTPVPATKRNDPGSANKDRLVPSLRCKRSPFWQEVRFRPLPTKCAGVA